ncbi:unnamed protein product [[Candida] boidinii]|uniref:Unnamed protein product n=1 Tax=Candida boidinii TaxID=5477 RepID=A0A9W6WAB1_CANBO|nr:unnamed protein product [[Candida] boidinii]GMF99651.1 unnamed protein product [[Candida] boidinii]
MVLDTKTIIKTLEKFTACDVSDALVKKGFKNGGFFPNLIRQSKRTESSTSASSSSDPEKVTPPMVGFAYTVLFAPYDDPRPEVKGGYIDALPEDCVLVIGTTKALQVPYHPFTKVNNALYGGLMSTRANYLKSKGTVVFGRVRDIDEHRALNRNVFSYGLGSTAHKPVVKMVGINVPLEIFVDNYPEGAYEVIRPGDFIVGDDNGVVRLPASYEADGDSAAESGSGVSPTLQAILEYIPKRVAADELVAEDIKAGEKATVAQKHRRQGL